MYFYSRLRQASLILGLLFVFLVVQPVFALNLSAHYSGLINLISDAEELEKASAEDLLDKGYTYYFNHNDDVRALKFFAKAAQKGSAPANYYLAVIYFDGEGIAKNLEKSAYWAKKGADLNDVQSKYFYAELLLYGSGVKKDTAEAYALFNELTQINETDYFSPEYAKYTLAVAYFFDNSSNTTQKILGQKFATQTHKNWLSKANNNEDVYFQQTAGLNYLYGIGTKRSPEKAMVLFKKAAVEGEAFSQGSLGFGYLYGVGVKKHTQTGLDWLQQAANQNDTYALITLGSLYREGRLVPRDIEKTIRFYQQADKLDDAEASYQLGWLYHAGKHVPEDKSLADRYFQRAFDLYLNHDTDYSYSANEALGIMYALGLGVSENRQQASYHFAKCIDNIKQEEANYGFDHTQYLLGFLYENGLAVHADNKLAIQWYKKAAAQKNEDAITALNRLFAQIR